jgi:hypothetical protein
MKAHTGHAGVSGVQNHSCGSHYPATIVCVGGFPTVDNDATAEVWYRGIKIKGFPNHATAELIANYLADCERTIGVEYAKTYAAGFEENDCTSLLNL